MTRESGKEAEERRKKIEFQKDRFIARGQTAFLSTFVHQPPQSRP